MKKTLNKAAVVLVLVFCLLSSSCGLINLYNQSPGNNSPSQEEEVDATLEDTETETTMTSTPKEVSSPTATKPDTGAISGELGYPSEYIPPLRVVAFDIDSETYFYVDTQRNQREYQVSDLPPGTYHVVAFVRDEGPNIPGGFSHFVLCGMTQDCENHQLVDVNVYAGETTGDVDPIDFIIHPEEAGWPENPTQ